MATLTEIAQSAAEEFTAAVWRAAPLGRKTLMEIVARFFEDKAVADAERTTVSLKRVGKAAAAR